MDNREVYAFCKQCISMDPLKQESMVDEKRAYFMTGVETLVEEKRIPAENKEKIFERCKNCYVARRVSALLSNEYLEKTFEDLGIKDPTKGE